MFWHRNQPFPFRDISLFCHSFHPVSPSPEIQELPELRLQFYLRQNVYQHNTPWTLCVVWQTFCYKSKTAVSPRVCKIPQWHHVASALPVPKYSHTLRIRLSPSVGGTRDTLDPRDSSHQTLQALTVPTGSPLLHGTSRQYHHPLPNYHLW